MCMKNRKPRLMYLQIFSNKVFRKIIHQKKLHLPQKRKLLLLLQLARPKKELNHQEKLQWLRSTMPLKTNQKNLNNKIVNF